MQFSNHPVDHLSTGSLLKLDSLEFGELPWEKQTDSNYREV